MNGFIVLVSLLVLHTRVDCMTKNGKKTCSQLTSAIQNIPQAMILKNPTQGLRFSTMLFTCTLDLNFIVVNGSDYHGFITRF
jgi:hypothetical protein